MIEVEFERIVPVVQQRADGVALRVEPAPVLPHDHAGAGRGDVHPHLDPDLLGEILLLIGQLGQQGRADLTRGAQHRDGRGRLGQCEGHVGGAEGAGGVVPVDYHRDLTLGGALGDEADVHVGAGEGGHEGGGNSRVHGHSFTDDGHDGHPSVAADRVDGTPCELQLEPVVDGGQRPFPLVLGNRHSDGTLAGRLGNNQYVHPRVGQGTHEPFGHIGTSNHTGALQGHQRNFIDGRNALDGNFSPLGPPILRLALGVHLLQGGTPSADHGALERGVENVPDVDGYLVVDARDHGGRMQDLRSEVRQFDRLVVLETRDAERLGHAAGIGGVHAVGILPHGDASGAGQFGEDGGGIVGSGTLEGGGDAVGGGGDESRHHHDGRFGVGAVVFEIEKAVVPPDGVPPVGHAGGGLGVQGDDSSRGGAPLLPQPGVAGVALDDQNFPRVDPFARNAPRLQVRVQRLRGPNLAESCNDLHRHGRDGIDHAQTLHDGQNVPLVLTESFLDDVGNFGGGQFLQQGDL
mmetsp:Transcript_26023/g.77015  ORF Transcript_26023/g.77015 Transcript_26023/m.77015 type:complete len:519 (-) Transcript_26023:1323-2879(-)